MYIGNWVNKKSWGGGDGFFIGGLRALVFYTPTPVGVGHALLLDSLVMDRTNKKFFDSVGMNMLGLETSEYQSCCHCCSCGWNQMPFSRDSSC